MTHNVIGLDIGGTKIYAARYSSELEVLADTKLPTEADQGRDTVLHNMLRAIEDVRDEGTQAVGISWAGFVDSKNGIVRKAPNIPGFEDFALTDFLSEKTGLPVALENDARLFALAEQQCDPEKPEVLLGIIFGTGVGSGIIINGQIFHGSGNFAGEIGHMVLNVGDERVEVEDLFAGRGVNTLFQSHFGAFSLEAMDEMIATDRAGVLRVFEPRLDRLAIWLVDLLLAYNPEKVVFGGGVGQHFWSLFGDEIQEKVQVILDEKGYPLEFNLAFSTLDNAGAMGAAVLAWAMSNE